MATYSPSIAIFFLILEFFRYQPDRDRSWTAEEILETLKDRTFALRERGLREYFERHIFRHPRNESPVAWLTSILRDLAELGLVEQDAGHEEAGGFTRWKIGQNWRPPEPPAGGGGGGTDRPRDSDGDDNQSGGLREVLGHPVLLALSADDFNALANNLFEDVQG